MASDAALVLHLAALLVKQWPPEEQYVRLWVVDHVVHPPARLLHAITSPFRLGEQPVLGHNTGNVAG